MKIEFIFLKDSREDKFRGILTEGSSTDWHKIAKIPVNGLVNRMTSSDFGAHTEIFLNVLFATEDE